MGPKFTDQQDLAITTKDVSVALAAGAGCGKTFVLTHRFLSYLDPQGKSDPLSGIVAITFTERAAREMRHRIREACSAALNSCAEKDVDYWLRILRGLETARITTIHSFCASFLRMHAVDAGLDPQFGLMEPAFADPLLQRLVNDTLHQELEQRNPDALQLVRDFGLEKTSSYIKKMVEKRFQIETVHYELKEESLTVEEWTQYYKKIFQPDLIAELLDSPAFLSLRKLLKENECQAPKMEERRKIIVNIFKEFSKWPDPVEALTELQKHLHLKGVRATHWESEDIHEELKKVFKQVKDDLKKITEFDLLLDEDLTAIITVSQQVFRLSQQASWAFSEYKREQGLLDFDDLLLVTRNLLQDSPSLRKKATSGIDYLMVDEFQDTDPVQTVIVRRLCDQQLLTGKLFLVGDVKQSIYRFRRADPEVFVSLRAEIPKAGQLPLSTNFRSQPEVLRFVNILFHDEVEENYEPLQPFSSQQLTPKPAIEFLWADPKLWDKKASTNERRKVEAETIAKRIALFLEDETPKVRVKDAQSGQSTLRRTEPGDIVILFRAMSNIALYEEALRNLNLDYYLVGGRAFYAQQEVYDFINICQFLDDPTDETSLAGVLRSPFFGITDDTIFSLKYKAKPISNEPVPTLIQAIAGELPSFLPPDQQQQLRHAHAVLTFLREHKDRWALVKLFQYLLDQTGYDASLLHEFMGRRKVANLRKLIDMARQFDRSGMYTLSDFVSRLRTSVKEESKEELATTHPETSNVIRLMTVHQSKGLEFPIVFVADCSWQPQGQQAAVGFHAQLGPLVKPPVKQGVIIKSLGHEIYAQEEKWADREEYKRVFYVATTRAADMLVLSAAFEESDIYRSPWMQLLKRKFDLKTGLLVGDPFLGQIAKPGMNKDEIPHIRVWRETPKPETAEKKKTIRLAPLSDFESLVANAEPVALPEMLNPLDPNPSQKTLFSVSNIEQIIEENFHSETIEKPVVDFSNRSNQVAIPTEYATTLGDIVHGVIECAHYENPINIPYEVERITDQLHARIPEEVRQRAISCLTPFFDSTLPDELKSATQHFREIDFLLDWSTESSTSSTDSPLLISGQIDCLFQSASGAWHLWDYKTGIHTDPAYLLRHYQLQLTIYALAIEEMLGVIPEKIELIHLGQKVSRIQYCLHDETVAKIKKQINQAIDYLREGVNHNVSST